MKTPSIPCKPLTDITIDFVGPLRQANHYDMILTCTCRLSGYVQIIPVLQKDTAEKTASRFFAEWVAKFGPRSSIISDRDKTWTSHFWKALMNKLGINFHMTTAFHPQADGRSERSNKTVGQILRTFTAKRQSKWLESLPAVKMAINSAVNVKTGYSPFELLFGRKPPAFPTNTNTDNAEASSPAALERWLRLREQAWTEARDALWVSRVKQATQHNKHRSDAPPLSVGDWVLLDSADWRGRHQGSVDKLKERYEGPYRILQTFNNRINVTLALPEGDKRHPTFHVSKIKRFFSPDNIMRTNISSPTD